MLLCSLLFSLLRVTIIQYIASKKAESIIYLPPMPGKTEPTTFLHLGVRAASSASGSKGGARRPSIATARCRAHSRLRVVSAGGIWAGGIAAAAVVTERCGVADKSVICWLLPAVVEDAAGADVIRRAMRWPSDVGGCDVRCGGGMSMSLMSVVGWFSSARDPRSRFLRMMRSRRTIAFVTFLGQ
jgi:hypothetical protein